MKHFPLYKLNRFSGAKGCLAFFLFWMLTSCMPEPLELEDIPDVKPEMVVATQMIGNQSVVVLLTRTFSTKEISKEKSPEESFEAIAINDALVTISGPGRMDTLELQESGIYGGWDIPLLEGETYELHVRSETFGTASATTQVQAQVAFEAVEATLYYEGLDDTLAVVFYEFRDPVKENNYMLNVQKVGQENLFRNAINPKAYTLLFDDSDFNGTLFEEYFTFSPAGFAAGDTVAVSLANISKEYFHFMELRAEKRLSFLEFLSEPANYPSNIAGGKGFFNLYVPDVRLLALKADR